MDGVTEAIDGLRAGRFILATADDDGSQIHQLIVDMAADPPSYLRFAIELANITIGLSQQLLGPEWREVLGLALHDLEVTHPDEP